MFLEYESLSDLERYKIMSDTIVPRPIAWIVTEDEDVVNIAPFSYFAPLSSNPATLIVSIGQKSDGTPKDTLANILKQKRATICFVNKKNLEKMKLSATALEKSKSEAIEFDIQTKRVLADFPPIITSSQSALFCSYFTTVELPGKTTPIILEIQQQFIEDQRIDQKKHIELENIGRAGASYAQMVKI